MDLTNKPVLKELLIKFKEKRLTHKDAEYLIGLLNIEFPSDKIERMIFVLEGYLTGFIDLGENN